MKSQWTLTVPKNGTKRYKQNKYKDTNCLKVKEWRTIYYANVNQKKDGVAALISNKVDF